MVFHFTGLGYRLVDEKPHAWGFTRGRTGGLWAGLCGTDIRELYTTLTVSSVPAREGELLVNCVWSVRARATWIEGRDIKKLEMEGHQLKSLLGGADDPTSADTEPKNLSRYSVAAMIGAVLSVFFVAATVISSVAVTQNSVWLVRPIDGSPLLICVLVVGVAGATTTVVGLASISAIRASKERVTGLGLAFTAAILFPLLLIDVIICGLLFVVSNVLLPECSFPEPLLIALMPLRISEKSTDTY